MKKIIVDTNLLIRNPQLFLDEEYTGSEFIIPIYVLGEIDKHKSRDGSVGYGARLFGRVLNELVEGQDGNLKDGITLENGNVVKVFVPNLKQQFKIKLHSGFSTYVDDLIISMSKLYFKEASMLTGDHNLKHKASAIGMPVMFTSKSTLNLLSDLYKGRIELAQIQGEDLFRVERNDFSPLKSIFIEETGRKPYPNEFVTFGNHIIAIYDSKKGVFKELKFGNRKAWGIKAKNIEQKMATELLLNPEIQLVTLTGSAGTGKTFLALASALEQVVENDTYEKILIGKNTAPLDKNSYQGFTSGDTTEKLMTHFGNYFTTLENLSSKGESFEKDGVKMKTNGGVAQYEQFNKSGQMEILDISSIMGSSFKGKFIIIDEAQSFDMNAMRSILTRVGEGTKIVLIGDVLQSTIANLSGNQSGLFNTVDWLKDVEEVGHVTLKKVERSTLVRKIAKIFDEKLYG